MSYSLTCTVSVKNVRDLDDDTVRTLGGLTRRQWGLMRRDFQVARNCPVGHPNEEAFVVVARNGSKICGWALVHATAMEYREKPYSRKKVYLHAEWLMYVYVAKSHRGMSLGSLLVDRTCSEQEMRSGAKLRVRPWDRPSAALFARYEGRVQWHDHEAPSKWLSQAAAQQAQVRAPVCRYMKHERCAHQTPAAHPGQGRA